MSKSRFPESKEIKSNLFWWLNLHKNVKTMLFSVNYFQTLFIFSKMAYSCCCSWGGNLDDLDFLQKKVLKHWLEIKFWKKILNVTARHDGAWIKMKLRPIGDRVRSEHPFSIFLVLIKFPQVRFYVRLSIIFSQAMLFPRIETREREREKKPFW